MNIKHSSESVNHFTPPNYAESIRKVLGGIEFDPCSCIEANVIIKATRFNRSTGLQVNWIGETVFCNPPGGKTDNKSNQDIWFRKMLTEYKQGNFNQGIFLAFNNSILRTSPESYADFPFVVPKQRIKFWNKEEDLIEQAQKNKTFNVLKHFAKCKENRMYINTPLGGLYPSPSPTHDNVIIYFPPTGLQCKSRLESFAEEFSLYGRVRI